MGALIGLVGAWALAMSAHAARVVDDTGAAVELASPARRIVTLAPHAAELVASAGAASKLVALAPDLVVTWPWTAPAQVARLRDRGIAVFTTAPRTIDAIAADIEKLGALAGTSTAAARS